MLHLITTLSMSKNSEACSNTNRILPHISQLYRRFTAFIKSSLSQNKRVLDFSCSTLSSISILYFLLWAKAASKNVKYICWCMSCLNDFTRLQEINGTSTMLISFSLYSFSKITSFTLVYNTQSRPSILVLYI